MSKSLEAVAKEKIKSNSEEIFSIEYNEKKYWIKKARVTKSTFLHRFYYFLFPFEVLIPSQAKSGIESIAHETSKLEQFNKLGINAAKVIYKSEEFFILEDCGETINTITRDKSISEEQMYYFINKLIFELAKIHKNNLYHGGAQSRNFTYLKGKVYAIDLEESFSSEIDLKVLQFRDFLLLLLSFIKIKANFDLDYKYIIMKYVELSGNFKTIDKLKKLAKKISFLIYLSDKKFVQKFLGSDVKGFFKLFKILKTL